MASDEADSSGSGDRPREPAVEEAFDRLVSEGSDRLARPLVPLIVGGIGLVTSLRLLPTPHRVAEERNGQD